MFLKSFLAIFSGCIIVGNAFTTTGCVFNNNLQAMQAQIAQEVVQLAGLAARAGILSTNDNLDPNFVMNFYGNQKVSNLFPQWFPK